MASNSLPLHQHIVEMSEQFRSCRNIGLIEDAEEPMTGSDGAETTDAACGWPEPVCLTISILEGNSGETYGAEEARLRSI